MKDDEFLDFAKDKIEDIKCQLEELDCLEDEDKTELEQNIISLLCDLESKINN